MRSCHVFEPSADSLGYLITEPRQFFPFKKGRNQSVSKWDRNLANQKGNIPEVALKHRNNIDLETAMHGYEFSWRLMSTKGPGGWSIHTPK